MLVRVVVEIGGNLILMVGRGVGEWTGLNLNLGKRGEQGRRGVVNGAGWMMDDGNLRDGRDGMSLM